LTVAPTSLVFPREGYPVSAITNDDSS